MDASQNDVKVHSCGIDSFGLEQLAGGLQMRLESCGSELPGAVETA